MKIPIKPGTTPLSQAPYCILELAREAMATLKYLYEHGLSCDSLSEYAVPVTLAPKPDGTW
eukprot:1671977-Rhodomonas_salina.1